MFTGGTLAPPRGTASFFLPFFPHNDRYKSITNRGKLEKEEQSLKREF